MRIRVKQAIPGGVRRIDSFSSIDNAVIEENLLDPDRESISIFFKGNNSSGILNLTTSEFEALVRSVKPFTHLVKKEAPKKRVVKKTSSKKKTAVRKRTAKKARSKKK